ncbi:MAG: DUF692 family multinuclear iron-containing protein [Nitrospira sp.]
MPVQAKVHHEFLRRLEAIPVHGLGLSVDIHAPDLTSLRRSLDQHHVPLSYLEVFHATAMALKNVKQDIGDGRLAYHGEGLWVTQPEMAETKAFHHTFSQTVDHLLVLQSAWLNLECAAKVLADHYFGTYLPPLYTRSSAEIVSENICEIQRRLGQDCELANGSTPLVMLEMPPLTYFVAGTLAIPSFFRLVCEQSPCGLVLDVGHLWTVFRYSRACRTQSLERFVSSFLDEFPIERVVEIHVAGLALHNSHQTGCAIPSGHNNDRMFPAWIDAHAAPIPSVLFQMLDQIVGHPRLTNLKGLALEVDTKPVELIIDEFSEFSRRYRSALSRIPITQTVSCSTEASWLLGVQSSSTTKRGLKEAYERYVSVLTSRAEPVGPEWELASAYGDELDRYRIEYLPHEVLHWGGDLEDMFIESCRGLKERGLSLEGFVRYWFREPRPSSGSYDFFLLKIERFVEFVREVAPDLDCIAKQEAGELRLAYRLVNEPAVQAEVGLK